MTGAEDPDALRADILDHWQHAAPGWAARRERVREFGMPVSDRMIGAVSPQPGERVLELAAGVGDTGLIAAEAIRPGGTLVSSDASEGMLEAAQARAAELGVENVEFKLLELEWIDLPTASVDAVLCRWGFMFAVDPGAALSETRRVLRPGGRFATAVWDGREHNPWATIPTRALVELGHVEPPDPTGPGMFALATPGRLADLLGDAGFTEVTVEAVDFEARHESVDAYFEETGELSRAFGDVVAGLPDAAREAVQAKLAELTAPFASGPDGALRMPARSLVASASA
ncbi:MAG TPA: methyltransferase domain-containing protein [Solirubrobacteraceae bacterium]|jgi:SAM-dependent methyltransferase|nr:methyltransferase domain-containing protein [Solirubrobacteraceae bacterium]